MYSCQAAATWCIINKPIRKKGLFVTFKAAFFDRDNTLVYQTKAYVINAASLYAPGPVGTIH